MISKKLKLVLSLSLISILVILACKKQETDKIPITTTSEVARAAFLKGRDLSERLKAEEAIKHFEKAIALDPDFAMAHLNLAFMLMNAKETFAEIEKAASLVDKVSEGEKLYILGTQASVNGMTAKEREYFQKLTLMMKEHNSGWGCTITSNRTITLLWVSSEEQQKSIRIFHWPITFWVTRIVF